MKPVILIILDGFGLSPITDGNAVYLAKTPFFEWAIANSSAVSLHASGAEVGLDWGEMGNSEVGHLNIGTGRIVMQDLPRIDRSIEDNTFFANQVLLDLAAVVREKKSTLHVIGIASEGGVHGHLRHMIAVLDFAKREKLASVAFHLITDGRDTPAKQFEKDLPKLDKAIQQFGRGVIASISGRYFAMDRDKRWDRTQKAYHAMVLGEGRTARSAAEAIQIARQARESDEFIVPTVLVDGAGKPLAPIEKHDAVLFTNYRSDRARQLATALTSTKFMDFPRPGDPVSLFASFASYGQEASHSVKVAFFTPPVTNQLADVVAAGSLPQLHVAETEKYAHVTYFLNGGREDKFPKEERILVPSPKVATYDQKPEMSAAEITKKFVERLKHNPPAFSVINFANPDMVGHTGDIRATVRAIEAVDRCLATIADAASGAGATLFITADHGNAEQLINPETHEIDKEHTTNPVPLLCISAGSIKAQSEASKDIKVQFATQTPVGVLADIAPTVLEVLELPKPAEMTGQSLLSLFSQ